MSEFVLGVDLDGVCADYNTAFRHAVARHRGIDPSELTTEVTWDFGEWGLDREGFLAHHHRAVREDGLFRNAPPIEGASEVLWRLSDAGVWIRIITHRLVSNWSHKRVVADTVEWLDDARIPYRDICFLGHKPQVEADAYIDALHDSLRFFADYELPDDWRASLAGFHAAGLPVDLMRRALDTAIDNRRIDWKGRWKYACGTAWRMLSAIQQEARNLIENGDESHENPGGQDAPREHGEGGA